MEGRKDREKTEAELDRELEESFPGSDPLQITRAPPRAELTPHPDPSEDEPPDPILPPEKDLKW